MYLYINKLSHLIQYLVNYAKQVSHIKELLRNVNFSTKPMNNKGYLEQTVQFLKPLLEKWQFKYKKEGDGISSGGEFSNGFFENEKIKIGLIYRGDKFGSVNYETNYSNISHDMIIKYLKKEYEQHLFYSEDKFDSFTKNNETIEIALFKDLENIIMPYILETDIEEINKMIKRERKKIGL
ncbi:MAG: hypothetical protein ACD_7C00462G0003 [uncultured bacterium]|nr:MAG: hypothetical protein ACD_7C00462G0003 [uncultured bacterium]